MAFPVGYAPDPRRALELPLPGAPGPPPRTHVRLELVEGQDAWVEVVRAGVLGAPDEFAVRDRTGLLLRAGEEDLAEVIECATGVHHGRAERLAQRARRELG